MSAQRQSSNSDSDTRQLPSAANTAIDLTQQDLVVEKLESGSKPPIAPATPIEGGVKGWVTVAGAWCVLFATFGMTNAYGVFQDYYVRFYLTKYSPSDISWIGSTQLFFQFSMGIIAGLFFDRGWFYEMMIGSSILYVFSYYMLSLAKPEQYYQIFLTQGVGAGIALGFMFLPSVGVIAQHFQRRRSLAMGIVVSGSSCGGMVFPILLNKMIDRHGFAWATRIVAFVCTGLLAIALATMRTNGNPKKLANSKDLPPPITLGELLKDVKYLLATAGAFFNIWGIFLPFFFLQLFAVVKGLDRNLAFYTLTILNGASVLGRVLPNFVGDVWGVFNTLVVCCFAAGILILGMLGIKDAAGIIVFAVLYGFFSGAYISLISPMFITLANSPREIGIRMGVAFTIVSFAGLSGTPIAGALLTSQFKWYRPIAFSAASLILGTSLMLAARTMIARQRNTWKI